MADEDSSANAAAGAETSTSGAAGGRFPCSGCGAELAYSPSQASLVCPYCGSLEVIPESPDEVVERDFAQALRATGESLATIHGLDFEVRCQVCGAAILVPGKTASEACPYCGSKIDNQPVEAQAMLPPESILPFKIERRDATAAFRQWIAGRWFAPSDLARFATEGRILGLYVPYWTFDCDTTSDYSGLRGDHYWVTETYQTTDTRGQTVTQTRQVMQTAWRPASGRVEHAFDDVLIAASHSLPGDYLTALEPWDLADLVPFQAAYLSGFCTERYQVPLEQGFVLAKGRMGPTIRTRCQRDMGGDVQQLHSVQTEYQNITFKHVLLPVWHGVYRYRDRAFHIMINARTGEVQGERPTSWIKVTLAILAAAAVAGLVAWFASQNMG